MPFSSLFRLIPARAAASAGALFLLVLTPWHAAHGGGGPGSPVREEARRLGERIYREGILPSGKPLAATVSGRNDVSGTSFACISCHMSSGLGSYGEGVFTTPVNGPSLFTARQAPKGINSVMSGGMGKNMGQPQPKAAPARPAYTDETLAVALRTGVDPAGRTLNAVMPRYPLQDGEFSALAAYLKGLSAQESPGVDARYLRFATVIGEDVPAARDEQARLLEQLLERWNRKSDEHEKRLKDPVQGKNLNKNYHLLHRTVTLSRWVLKGPQESWRAQLEEYQRREPVFALLGGIVPGEWRPVHDFCEANRIPCLFPQTDLPVVSATATYTYYLSKGYYQEGESTARFLAAGGGEHPVLQVVRESKEGRALAEGFAATWRALGRPAPATLTLPPGEAVDRAALLKALPGEPATVLIWDGAPGARAAAGVLVRERERVASLFLSGRYAGTASSLVPESLRGRTYLSYPFRLPQEEKSGEEYYLGEDARKNQGKEEVLRAMKLTFPISRVLVDTVGEMKSNFYRDYFLDLVTEHRGFDVPLYQRLEFASGLRYASSGCYLVQFASPDSPELVPRSEWVVN